MNSSVNLPAVINRPRIVGTDLQVLVLSLAPGESINAYKGAFCFGEAGIAISASLNDGSKQTKGFFGKIGSSISRMISGESAFLQQMTNTSNRPQKVGLSSPQMGEIYSCQLSDDGPLFVTSGAMVATTPGIHIDFHVIKNVKTGLFGGEGLTLQKLSGKGFAYISAGGSIVQHHLEAETLNIDTGSLLGYHGDIQFNTKLSGGLATMAFGGEGIFLSSMKGTGSVWIESFPAGRQAELIYQQIKKQIKKDIKRAVK